MVKKVLVAWATWYLGKYIVQELKARGYRVRVLVRTKEQQSLFPFVDEVYKGQVTQPETINNCTKDIDWVVSTVGITRQKDGFCYMDVDYQGNHNILQDALKNNVASFLYVSALNGEKLRHIKIFEAKERFVDELQSSTLHTTIVRPNWFFSDMKDFLHMAKKWTVYLFGTWENKVNPIHGKDLAVACVDALESKQTELEIGGPTVRTQNQIASLAFDARWKQWRIIHLPDIIRKMIIWLLRTFTSSKTYWPFEFFLTVMASDNVAKQYGTHSLQSFFKKEAQE